MTFTANDTTRQAIATFQQFDTDTKLALLWYGYLDLKDHLHPANPPSADVPATAVCHAITAMPQEQQLQAQREIVNKANTDISRSYGALSSSGQLAVWLKLAQGMEAGEIINLPSDYHLPSETDEFTAQIKQLDFEERVNFMRSIAVEMGTK